MRGESAAAEEASADYVNTVDWFCRRGRCPAFVGTTPVTVDGSHVSIPFAESLAPLLRQALLRPERVRGVALTGRLTGDGVSGGRARGRSSRPRASGRGRGVAAVDDPRDRDVLLAARPGRGRRTPATR